MARLITEAFHAPAGRAVDFVNQYDGFVQVTSPKAIPVPGWVATRNWEHGPMEALESHRASVVDGSVVFWGWCNPYKTLAQIIDESLSPFSDGEFSVWAPVPYSGDIDDMVDFRCSGERGEYEIFRTIVPMIQSPGPERSRHILRNMSWLYENNGEQLVRDYGRHLSRYIDMGILITADAVQRGPVQNGELRWYEDDGILAPPRLKKNEFHAQPLPLP